MSELSIVDDLERRFLLLFEALLFIAVLPNPTGSAVVWSCFAGAGGGTSTVSIVSGSGGSAARSSLRLVKRFVFNGREESFSFSMLCCCEQGRFAGRIGFFAIVSLDGWSCFVSDVYGRESFRLLIEMIEFVDSENVDIVLPIPKDDGHDSVLANFGPSLGVRWTFKVISASDLIFLSEFVYHYDRDQSIGNEIISTSLC